MSKKREILPLGMRDNKVYTIKCDFKKCKSEGEVEMDKEIKNDDIEERKVGDGNIESSESHAENESVEQINNEQIVEEHLNPWLSIWTKPRKTMRYIINTNPTKHVLLLAMIFGIINVLDKSCEKSYGDDMSLYSILLIAILFGGILGIIYLYLNAALIKWTGTWIGGKGSSENIRAAISWGLVPYILVSILWIPELILFGKEMFTSNTPIMDSSLTLSTLFFVFVGIEFIGSIWGTIVGFKCLGEVQGFSAWKALGNYMLSILVVAVPIIVIVMLLFLL